MASKVDKTPKKIEVVPKPDEKLYKEKIQAETAAIDEIKAKINELQQKIAAVAGGREEYYQEKTNRLARLDAIQKQIDELEDKRKSLFDKIQSKQKEGADLKQKASELRRNIGFSTAEEVDKKIALLERSMITSTLSLKEEKQLLEDIKKLKSNKPLLSKYKQLEIDASNFDESSIIPLRAMLDEVRTKILELRTQKREESVKYKELLEKRQKATAPGREYIEERDRLSKLMNTHLVQRREVQAELAREMQKYQEYMQQVRRERGIKMREERERRNLEQQRTQLGFDLERVESELPYEDEVLLLTQTIMYLKKQTEDSPQETTEDAQEEKEQHLEGALLPKSQRAEVYYFAPTKNKKNKNKNNIEINKQSTKPKTLKYDLGTLAYFEQCGVAAPVLMEEVPHCMQQLEEKLKKFKALQDESSQKVEERKEAIMLKIREVDEKIANLKISSSSSSSSSSSADAAEAADEEEE